MIFLKKTFCTLGILFLTYLLSAQSDTVIIYKKIDTTELKIWIHYPEKVKKRHAAIIFFHGGGWNNGTAEQFLPQSEYLASRGMVAIRASYRLKNVHGTSPKEALEDAKSAIRFLRRHAKELHILPNKIAAGGGSAGGHLAAAHLCRYQTVCYGLDRPRELGSHEGTHFVKRLLHFCGPIDWSTLFQPGLISQGFENMSTTWPHVAIIINTTNEHAQFSGILRTIHMKDGIIFFLPGFETLWS